MVVAFGGGGDGPDPGGEVGGPFGVAAVVVLASDDGGAEGAFGFVVVQVEVGEVAVAGQAVPFAVQGGQDLLRGGVQAGARICSRRARSMAARALLNSACAVVYSAVPGSAAAIARCARYRSATAFNAPATVPSATSNPSAASARAIRCTVLRPRSSSA